jgi:two-component system, OmpR family, sensor kinase
VSGLRRATGFLKAGGRAVRRLVVWDSPPSLHSTLFRVILVAVLVPVLLSAWSAWRSTRDANPDVRSLEVVHAVRWQPVQMSDSDYKAMRKIVLERGGMLFDGSSSWPTSADYLVPFSMRDSVLSELTTKGWAYGEAVLEGKKARFAAWRDRGSVQDESGSLRLVVEVPQGWGPRILNWGFQILAILGFVCLVALPAAWFLERRIARPVNRLAQASRVMAEGGHPVPIPTKGPAEIFTLTDSFNKMAEKLEKAQMAERDFLLSVSHELKTPLTAIEGYAELLADGAVTGTEAAPVLVSEAERLRRLVNDLLDLAKMNQSAFSVRRDFVGLDAVVREVVQRYARQAQELGVTLVGDSSSAGTIVGDEDRLVQSLSNLIENAIRWSPRGGTVTIEAIGARVVVSDEGPGLSIEDIPHAFERFYLRNRQKSDHKVGTGLGLAIVRELVERMGGTVSVESEPGRGARFTILFAPD